MIGEQTDRSETFQVLSDLADRLHTKSLALDGIAAKESDGFETWLRGKADGIRLALSFVNEELRRMEGGGPS